MHFVPWHIFTLDLILFRKCVKLKKNNILKGYKSISVYTGPKSERMYSLIFGKIHETIGSEFVISF